MSTFEFMAVWGSWCARPSHKRKEPDRNRLLLPIYGLIMKFKSEKERYVIETMIKHGKIPNEGSFEITHDLVSLYNKIYLTNFVDSHFVYGEGVRPASVRFGEKLAGLSLLRLLKSRTITLEVKKAKIVTDSGFVYIISNPIFEGFYKIGMTKDMESRLNSYQTYDPLRRFKVEHYKFVDNAKQKEKEFLEIFSLDLAKGEWISPKDLKILKEVFFD